MSAAELTANGGTMSDDIAKRVDEAIGQLLDAQQLTLELQRELAPVALHSGDKAVIDKTALWHRLETIDDRLHDALSKLGN